MRVNLVDAAGPAVLRSLNRTAVLSTLASAGRPLRISEVAALTKLTRPTVTQAIEDLQSSDVIELATRPTEVQVQMGRPASSYQVRPRVDPVVGIDLGPHTVRMRISDLAGSDLASVARSVPPPHDNIAVAASLKRLVTDGLKQAELTSSDIQSVVVGLPGVIDPTSGATGLIASMPSWKIHSPMESVKQLLGGEVLMENDSNLVARAASLRWPGETLIAIHWGQRLGSGIVVNGQLHRGARHAAGEIGLIDLDGVLEFDELGYGPLERRVRVQELSQAVGVDEDPQSKQLMKAVTEKRSAAVEAVDRACFELARSLAPVILSLDPHRIVVSGGMARIGDLLTSALRRHLTPRVLYPPEIDLSPDAENSVVLGAVQSARQRVWDLRLPLPAAALDWPARRA